MAIERILINGVTEILKRLVPVVSQEIGSAWGVKNDLEKLQRTLEMILAVIADAERKQVRDEAVGIWLRRLRDVVYDADDVIDEFSYETMRLSERGSFKYKVRDFVSSSNPLSFRSKLAGQIKGINKKLDEITKDMERFQLEIITSSTTVPHGKSSERRSRQTTSFASQTQIVGREDDKNQLIKMLTASSTSLRNPPQEVLPVVSIVGMGGLGKTTLAQLVYNDDSVKKYFDLQIWVCVSDDFDVDRLLSDIMESINQEKFSGLSNFDGAKSLFTWWSTEDSKYGYHWKKKRATGYLLEKMICGTHLKGTATSYQYLQRCFSYCSIFPKGWVSSKQTLIQLWMAEGFLQPSNVGNNCLLEDIGDEYFESLMWSSFFDGVKRNQLGDVMTFKMHDLVHDLAQAVSGDHECATTKTLQFADVYNFMGCDLPKWMCVPSSGTLLNLDKLEFIDCKTIKQLPAGLIGQLPRLRFLYLTGMSLKSLDIGGLPSLIWLSLTDMLLLEDLCYSHHPCLENLMFQVPLSRLNSHSQKAKLT